MKNKSRILITLLAVTAGLLAIGPIKTQAQTTIQGIQIQGTVFQYQGQNFLITTNSSGGLEVMTFGIQGTNVFTVPATPEQAMAVASAWLGANNPAAITDYGTNELEARLGAAYLQNSGQAAALISIERWGIFGVQNIGIGAGILEGSNGGTQGTAGEYGEIDYRKPIGNVAAVAGIVGGYDNWNSKPFGGVKAGLENRSTANLGEFIDVIYAVEPRVKNRGLIIAGGLTYVIPGT